MLRGIDVLHSEANSRSSNQELLRLYGTFEVHDCVHKSTPLATVLRRMQLISTHSFFQILFNIILITSLMSSK
jgi:hypothetical protein